MTDQRWYATLYDAVANHAKYYDLRLEGNEVYATWGRVGAANPGHATYTGGRVAFDRKRNEKMRKGYTEVAIADGAGRLDAEGLVVAAQQGLIDPAVTTSTTTASPRPAVLTRLIERIARANKHRITSATGGRVTFDPTGHATLPGGILLTQRGIDRARTTLDLLAAATDYRDRLRLLQDYLRLVPHAIGVARGWEDRILRTPAEFAAERDLLDALEGSLTIASAADAPRVAFRYRVREASADEFAEVKAEYDRTRNAGHAVSGLTVQRVYALTDTEGDRVAAYAARHRNVARRWHGTQTHNVLNILRTGLQFADGSTPGFDYHGALLGPGIYSSSMSTKAAGYGFGTWGGARDRACFVFLADISRGREYRVTGGMDWRGSRRPDAEGRTYRSVEAYGGVTGARNPETTVWDVDAVALRYIVELG